MAANEIFDIFDENMTEIGQDTREQVHAQGLWHQTFHCWVWNRSEKGEQLLLQLRHKDKDTFPDQLDVSCGGHLLTGEGPEDGVRELEEELGISADVNDLVYCGLIAQENIISEQLIDREFNHIYIYECNKELEQYQVQAEEVSGLFFISVSDFRELVFGLADEVSVEGIIYEEGTGRLIQSQRTIRLDDLTPNSYDYYDLIFSKLENLMSAEKSVGE